MQHKILYTADMHGNETQYRKLVNYAKRISTDTVIIGGDITPKKFPSNDYLKGQRQFITERLPKLLKPLKDSKSKILLMMGNDDCAANMDVLEEKSPDLYYVIHGKRINIVGGFDIVGYSYVPITPFGLKDWEKFDLTYVPPGLESYYESRKSKNYNLQGAKTTKLGWERFTFTPLIEKRDSIQRDLNKDLFNKKPEKTIYVFHSPPDKTYLDQVITGEHAGSMAIKSFIEEAQPYLTLHGHIHETVGFSGQFKQLIGKTLCMSSGNHDVGDNLAVLVFDLYNPKDAKRIIL